MIIDKSRTYRTRDGREARIYATDGRGPWPVHGAVRAGDAWVATTWRLTGKQDHDTPCGIDLTESDPHGILPRHRELLASVYQGRRYWETAAELRGDKSIGALRYDVQAALIALARLEKEKGE